MPHPPRDPLAEIEALRDAVHALESRVAALEGRAPAGAEVGARIEDGESPASAAPAGTGSLANGVAFAGRSLLVLGGAFLLRALTENGLLSRSMGAAAGLVYAMAWVALLVRTRARLSPLSAAFHGATAALIVFPLLWEITVRFRLIDPAASAAALAGVTAAALAVAALRELRLVAWIFALGATATAAGLLLATHEVELYAGALVLTGLATVVTGMARGWSALRWPVALAADLAVLFGVVLVSGNEGPPDAWRHASPAAVQAVALGLAAAYVGAFAVQALLLRREASLFEAVQTIAVLVVGIGGASRIARAAGDPGLLPGLAALLLSVAAYALAFTFVDRRLKVRRNFYYFAWLGLAALFVGVGVVTRALPLTALLGAFALACAGLGARYRRVTLRIHSAVYAAAAALQGGLVDAAARVFFAPPDRAWPALALPPLLVTATAGVCFVFLARSRREPGIPWHRHVPRLVHGAVLIAGAGLLLVRLLAGLVTEAPPGADGALLAVVRTAVLAAAVIVLTVAGRRGGFVELGWLVYPVLATGALKLLLEDFRRGHAGTLFLGLACYGAALIFSARFGRR